jgi:hypothetical protein
VDCVELEDELMLLEELLEDDSEEVLLEILEVD